MQVCIKCRFSKYHDTDFQRIMLSHTATIRFSVCGCSGCSTSLPILNVVCHFNFSHYIEYVISLVIKLNMQFYEVSLKVKMQNRRTAKQNLCNGVGASAFHAICHYLSPLPSPFWVRLTQCYHLVF